MTEEELKLAAKNYIKRDGTNAEKLLDSIKLSLTKKEAATLLACMQQCYMDGSIETTKELQEYNLMLEKQIEEMKSDVKSNIKWADQNKNGQMWQKLVKMYNQWEQKHK